MATDKNIAISWLLKQHFNGAPKLQDFQLVKEPLKDLKENEITIESFYLSPDPYQRLFSMGLKPPCVMLGTSIAKVIRSNNPDYPIDSTVFSNHGWILRGNVDPTKHVEHGVMNFGRIPDSDHPSHYLGLYGLTGLTAYYGLIKHCQPKKGEVVFVNAASGGVGHLVGQIAKILGCKVIGTTGHDSKVQWLKDLGFDIVYNYKSVDLNEALKNDVPEGIDVFYDNVGGPASSTVWSHMNLNGRVVVVGVIGAYNSTKQVMVPDPTSLILTKKLSVSGFHFFDYMNDLEEGRTQLSTWLKNGQLKLAQETILHGFEKMPEALIGLFEQTSNNLGKVIVQAYPNGNQ